MSRSAGEHMYASCVQEFPGNAVSLFSAITISTNLCQTDIQLIDSALHDSDNFVRVSNECLERFTDPGEQDDAPNQYGGLEEQENCDDSHKDRLQRFRVHSPTVGDLIVPRPDQILLLTSV
jgi:hypothetical protein